MGKAKPTTHASWALLLAAVAAACGGSGGADMVGQPGGAPGGAPGSAADAGGGGTGAPGSGGASDSGAADTSPPAPSADSGVAGSEGGAGKPGDGGAGMIGNGATPTLPSPTGNCPTFTNGMVTFNPATIPSRAAQVYMSSAAATMHGPLILYWYATGSSTAEVQYSLNTTLASIEAAGGIVVAPQADPNAGQFEWYQVNGSPKLDDFLVADEIVACAAKMTGIDTTHIHSMGMSAGALQTTDMSYLRSSYLASVVTYSGGTPPSFAQTMQDPANRFAALIFDGGTNDDVFGVNFQAASQAFYATLKSAGHFAAICDHGMGHAIPTAAAPSVWAFFQANGFGVYPSPYASGLPAGFPSYCML